MLLFCLLLCCAALGDSVGPNVAPPASRHARTRVTQRWKVYMCLLSLVRHRVPRWVAGEVL